MWIASFWYSPKPGQMSFLKAELDPSRTPFIQKTDPEWLVLKGGHKIFKPTIHGEIEFQWIDEVSGTV